MSDLKIEINTPPNESSLQNQIIASFICSFGTFALGCSLGWLSPVLNDLQSSEDCVLETPMTDDDAAWAGGLLCIGGLVGQPIFNIVAKSRGRKPAAYVGGLALTISSVLKIYATSSIWILVSQLICGIGGAGTLALPPLYIGEISEPRARGGLSAMMMAQYSFGIFISYLLGAFVSYDTLNGILVIPPLVFLVGFWFIPETPHFRLKKGEEESAARAIAWLRKLPLNSIEVRAELYSLARQIRGAEIMEINMTPTKEDLTREMELLLVRKMAHHPDYSSNNPITLKHQFKKSIAPWKLMLSSRAAVRGIIIITSVITAQTLMGLSVISIYASVIFESVNIKLSSDTCSIIYSIILMIGCTASPLMMDSAGRRFLLISSCFIVCAGEVILGAFFEMSNNNYAPDWMSWLALISLTISVICYNMGAASVPFVLLSEYFSAEIHDQANNAILIYMWATGFLLLQYFTPCVEAFGIANVFYFFSFSSLISGIFSYLFVPETKGRTQEEILQILDSPRLTVI